MKPKEPTVARLIRKTLPILREQPSLSETESVFSSNKVTGASINVPIAGTCVPTKLCIEDCYAANNTQSWPSSLRKQARVQRAIEVDPIAFAERVALEHDRRELTYLRWNGVGDLTEPAVTSINHLIEVRPDIILWIVTRIPSLAAKIKHSPLAYIHFSLDGRSLDRRKEFLRAKPKSRNYFFSYQCEKGETPPRGASMGVSVIFHKRYRPATGADLSDPALCPLNTLQDCTSACAKCRRCFDGSAVAMRTGG